MIGNSTDYIGKNVSIIIDRPLGSRHREFPETRYDVNYGYLPNTLSYDGEEIDAYLLGVNTPMRRFCGSCIAVLQRVEEKDDKLIVVPAGVNLSDPEILEAVNFQEKYFTSRIIR